VVTSTLQVRSTSLYVALHLSTIRLGTMLTLKDTKRAFPIGSVVPVKLSNIVRIF